MSLLPVMENDGLRIKYDIVSEVTFDEKSKITTTMVTLVGYDDYYQKTIIQAVGSARCMEPDKYDRELGATLSLGRALKNLGAHLCKESQESVHEADRVRLQQEVAQEASRSKAYVAKKDFQQRFAQLIEEIHPGTFT